MRRLQSKFANEKEKEDFEYRKHISEIKQKYDELKMTDLQHSTMDAYNRYMSINGIDKKPRQKQTENPAKQRQQAAQLISEMTRKLDSSVGELSNSVAAQSTAENKVSKTYLEKFIQKVAVDDRLQQYKMKEELKQKMLQARGVYINKSLSPGLRPHVSDKLTQKMQNERL